MNDYITEKFYTGFISDSVMIYLGAPNAEDYAPAPHSFVNALDFDSPGSLSVYLKYLSQNDTAYRSYLDWKSKNTPLNKNFLIAVSRSYERLDNQSLLCRVCSSFVIS